ncbi:gp53-like domain-containing protein [Escherichia coli]|uniref:gp53-like domain-containing protein n=2 Tax=Escherichia coli TaxID=562 RepID=UPI0038908E04
MHRIDTKTAQKDKFGAGKNGFTRGNPQTGTPATDLDDDYFDMLQEELCSVVEASGASLEKGRHDQLLTALRALLLSRKNPFGDIKLDGTVQKALENLGLGEAAKRNVGTGANQIPDMGSFMLSASVPGYQKLPSGLIIQWGPIDVPLTSQDTVTYFPIAFPNRCLRVFATQDYTPGSANVGYIACAGYNRGPGEIYFQSRRTRYRCFIFRIRVLISFNFME